MKILVGKVFSNFMNKTVVVYVNIFIKNFLYKKYIKKIKKYYVHDEYNLSRKNDLVLIGFYKPISKKKFWVIIKFL